MPGTLRFGAKIVNLVGRPHTAGRSRDNRVRRRRGQGGPLAHRARWNVRRLADDPRAGAAGRTAALARMSALGQLVERAVPADAERVAGARILPGLARTISSAASSAASSSSDAEALDRSAALQLPVRRRGDPGDHKRKAREPWCATPSTSRGRRTSGRRAMASAISPRIGCGARQPTAKGNRVRQTR